MFTTSNFKQLQAATSNYNQLQATTSNYKQLQATFEISVFLVFIEHIFTVIFGKYSPAIFPPSFSFKNSDF